MPIYAYRCAACGQTKDVLQKVSDPVLTTCPFCGAESFAKQLTAAGFQLKGSGWYVTDFKGGNGSKPATADKSGESAGGATIAGGGKADSTKADSAQTAGQKEASGASAPASAAPSGA